MSRISFGLLLAITLMGAGCGYSSHNYMNGNGMPKITQLSPSSAMAGGPAFALTIQGTGFGTDSFGVLGHDDTDHHLRHDHSGDGEYHGGRHHECGHGTGLRALGRRELERHDSHHSVAKAARGLN
jgi:hypothetical protein